MKFENPIINISMFTVEDIITTSGENPTVEARTAEEKAKAALRADVYTTLSFTD